MLLRWNSVASELSNPLCPPPHRGGQCRGSTTSKPLRLCALDSPQQGEEGGREGVRDLEVAWDHCIFSGAPTACPGTIPVAVVAVTVYMTYV